MPTDCKLHGAIDARVTSTEKRLDSHGQELDTLKELLPRVITLQEVGDRRLADLEDGLKDLKAASGKKWEQATTYVAMAVIGAVVGFAMNNIGF